MIKTDLARGMSLVEIPEAGLSVLCGCPENAVKFLIKAGKVRSVERGGVRYETGPNAILLSEVPVQRGRFRNLGEFPVLQMLYRQGMILPGHPGNTGMRPMIIGMRDQVEAQSRYIYAGNYGLASVQELESAGLPREEAAELFRMKLKFAFGAIRKTEELLDLRVFEGHAIELRDGAFVRRTGANHYEFLHAGRALKVELDPGAGAKDLPYPLPRGEISRSAFSVVHIGEGDGWDTERPCMASIVQYRGELFLVDAGPDIEASLEALGLGIDDLSGIFHTHAHDDHFVGLTALLRARRRLAYFAVPWVRASVEAKLRALAGIGEREFRRYFEVRDLEEGRWNDLGGLEVRPTMSPHPVETTVLRFRARGDGPWRSYAHFADLAAFSVLDSMVQDDPALPGISGRQVALIKAGYLEKADVKKVDVGGGAIHGSAADFSGDESDLLYLSHNPDLGGPGGGALGGRTRIAAFGEENILIAQDGSPLGGEASPQAPEEGPADARLLDLLEATRPFSELAARRPSTRAREQRPAIEAIAASTTLERVASGASLCGEVGAGLRIIATGRARVLAGDKHVDFLGPGDVFGEEGLLVEGCCLFEAKAIGEVSAYHVPAAEIEARPILLWGLRELLESRLAKVKTAFDFAWLPSFSVGEPRLDEEHRRLFALIGELDSSIKDPEACPDSGPLIAELSDFMATHFASEEALMRSLDYPELAAHEREHESLRRDLAAYRARLDCGDRNLLSELDGFLKDWALRHTLLIDRLYIPYLGSSSRMARP